MEQSQSILTRGVFPSFWLKRIAVVSMVIDHIGSILLDGVLAPYRVGDTIVFTEDMPFFVRNAPAIKALCEALCSAAFPLFCFLLVEGASHTFNRARYALRLGVFALLSEIPFDLAHFGRAFDFSLQNVMFTLLVGLCLLMGLSEIERRKFIMGAYSLSRANAALVVLACAAAFLLRGEYVFLGPMSIFLMYLGRKNRFGRLLGLLPLFIASPWVLLAAPFLLLYDGTRGTGSQYFFYVFYPAHFLALYGLALLLSGRPV